RARSLVQTILSDRMASGSHLPQLRTWALSFLDLPDRVTRDHFEAFAGLDDVHLNRLGRTRARDAAEELKKDLGPGLYRQWIGEWFGALLDLLRTALSRINAAYRDKKRALARLDFADLEEESIRLLDSHLEIRRGVCARFDEILMDELQDT